MTFTPDDAMRQAKMTTEDYMQRAHKNAEEIFGPEWCRENPLALVTYMTGFAQAAAIDYGASLIGIKMDEVCDGYLGRGSDFVESICAAISDLKPET